MSKKRLRFAPSPDERGENEREKDNDDSTGVFVNFGLLKQKHVYVTEEVIHVEECLKDTELSILRWEKIDLVAEFEEAETEIEFHQNLLTLSDVTFSLTNSPYHKLQVTLNASNHGTFRAGFVLQIGNSTQKNNQEIKVVVFAQIYGTSQGTPSVRSGVRCIGWDMPDETSDFPE